MLVSDSDNTFYERIRGVILNYPGKSRDGHIEVVEFESELDLNKKDRQLIAELREAHENCI